jgi:hypothetical protein
MLSEVCVSTSEKERMGEASDTICTTAHQHMQGNKNRERKIIINSLRNGKYVVLPHHTQTGWGEDRERGEERFRVFHTLPGHTGFFTAAPCDEASG